MVRKRNLICTECGKPYSEYLLAGEQPWGECEDCAARAGERKRRYDAEGVQENS